MTVPQQVVVGGESVAWRAGVVAVGGVEIVSDAAAAGDGHLVSWRVRNPRRAAVAVDRVGLRIGWTPRQVLEHGYQSWSVVRRCGPGDARPPRGSLPAWARGLYLADPDAGRAGSVVAGDQFLVTDTGVVGFVDGRRHLSAVDAAGGVVAWALLDGVELQAGEERELDGLWVAEGDPGRLYSSFAGRWGDTMDARCSAEAPAGWCSWYHYFGDVTPADVRANLELATAHGLGLVQIDDGYQADIGDWLATAPPWSEGMAPLASAIRQRGAEAGIWTAPFLVSAGGELARAHPDWLAHDDRGRPLRAMVNPGWGGPSVALDTTHPAVLEHLTSTFAALRDQGYGYHKIDFCYAAALPGRRHDQTLTRAQALRAGLDAVRAGIGDDAFLLGCGCPLGPAVGVVDGMRVSADVAPRWDARPVAPGFEESAPSARNAVEASVLRAPLHRRLWINDPDCVLLRPIHTDLEPWQRRLLATAVAGAGAFVVVSDDLALYGRDEWQLLDQLRDLQAAGDVPLDIVDPFATPLTVRSPALELTIDWRDDAGPLPPPAGASRVVLEAGHGAAGGPAARLARRDD